MKPGLHGGLQGIDKEESLVLLKRKMRLAAANPAMSKWEREFLQSVSKREDLTERQMLVLNKIFKKAKR